ncbi:hypothetical protein JCM12178A_22190 [Salidesulfovibrio brasiliensis]
MLYSRAVPAYEHCVMNTFSITPAEPWLAPLAGYSDLPFRLLSKRHGCSVACSEMVSVKGLYYESPGTVRLMDTCPEDDPMVLQLFGSEPELYRPVMESLVEKGYRNYDLNAGCPVRKVLKSGSGVALMKDPDRLVSIARVMVEKASAHPLGGRVGVKFRLGFERGEDTFVDLARRLEDIGVDWVTMHPRYGKQVFTGSADWSRLAELKQAVTIPVIGSGDLYTAADGVRCLQETGIDAIMFARGAMHDPAIFNRFRTLMAGKTPEPMDGERLAALVREHITITKEYDGSSRSFRKVRSILPRYAKGLEGIRNFRNRVTRCETWEELDEAVAEIADMKSAERE